MRSPEGALRCAPTARSPSPLAPFCGRGMSSRNLSAS